MSTNNSQHTSSLSSIEVKKHLVTIVVGSEATLETPAAASMGKNVYAAQRPVASVESGLPLLIVDR